jgi:hypothetical protein
LFPPCSHSYILPLYDTEQFGGFLLCFVFASTSLNTTIGWVYVLWTLTLRLMYWLSPSISLRLFHPSKDLSWVLNWGFKITGLTQYPAFSLEFQNFLLEFPALGTRCV